MKTSLIVTTYNQKERLSLVLDSISNQVEFPDEVIVADDGSRSDTRDLIERHKKEFPIDLIHSWQEDIGYRLSRSRNIAISRAIGEYIVVIDGDMILEKSFIKDHKNSAKRAVFVQGSRVILADKASREIVKNMDYSLAFGSTKSFKSRRIESLSNFIFSISKIDKRYLDKHALKGIRGCNMAFFKKDALEINGFNEDFVGWGREDSEFVARFLFNGGELRRLKFSAIAYHIWHEENSRSMLDINHKIYLDTLSGKKTWCNNGIFK